MDLGTLQLADFSDFHLPETTGLVHPVISMIDRRTAIIGDWNGILRLFDFDSPSKVEVFAPEDSAPSGPSAIHGLHIEPLRRQTCVIVCRVGHFFVWQVGTDKFKKVFPEQYGPVNCAAFSPDGLRLAVGMGFYPLSSASAEARLTTWSITDPEPFCESSVLLPGVCVGDVAWAPGGNEIACLTGLRSQRSGFLITVEDGAAPRQFKELGKSMNRRVFYGNHDRVLVLGRGKIKCFSMPDATEMWEVQTADDCCTTFNAEENEVALGSGLILDASRGATVREVRPLEECSAIAVRPGGGYVGISKKGTLRVWN